MIGNFVKETTSAPGTSVTAVLNGATAPFKTFASAFLTGTTVFQCLRDGSQWEMSVGTFVTSPSHQISRTSVIANSAGTTSRLNFAGTTEVYSTVPAERMMFFDGSMVARLVSGTRFAQGVLVKTTSNKSISTGSETALSWDAATYDDATMYSAGNPTRLTVPAANFSRVQISANITWASNATGVRTIRLKKNGSYVVGLPAVTVASPGAVDFGQGCVSAEIQVSGSDYIEVTVTQNSGGSLNVLSSGDVTWASARLIR